MKQRQSLVIGKWNTCKQKVVCRGGRREPAYYRLLFVGRLYVLRRSFAVEVADWGRSGRIAKDQVESRW